MEITLFANQMCLINFCVLSKKNDAGYRFFKYAKNNIIPDDVIINCFDHYEMERFIYYCNFVFTNILEGIISWNFH